MRRGDAHLAEENVRELLVIVLAGMEEDGLNLWMALHFPHKRSDFRKIGACSDYIKDFQALAHVFAEFNGDISITVVFVLS